MLLQGTQSGQRPDSAAPARGELPANPSHQRRAAVPPPAVTPAVRARTYPPITWDHPSLGRVVAEGLGGISKSTLLIALFTAAFVGAAMAIALVITSIVSAFGISASASY